MTKKIHTIVDLLMVAFVLGAILLPFVVYIWVDRWMERIATANPGSPPDQGAMIVGGLLVMISIPVSIVIAVVAGYLFVRRRKSAKANV